MSEAGDLKSENGSVSYYSSNRPPFYPNSFPYASPGGFSPSPYPYVNKPIIDHSSDRSSVMSLNKPPTQSNNSSQFEKMTNIILEHIQAYSKGNEGINKELIKSYCRKYYYYGPNLESACGKAFEQVSD